jgi:hypothetical protein
MKSQLRPQPVRPDGVQRRRQLYFADAGSKILYAWAKDAAGASKQSRTVTITLSDSSAPVVRHSIPATSTSLTITISL